MRRKAGILVASVFLSGALELSGGDGCMPEKEGGAPGEGNGEEAAKAEEAPKDTAAAKLTRLLEQLDLAAFLETSATLNLDRPSGDTNDYRAFDVKARSFQIDMLKLQLEKVPDESLPVGFRADLLFGEVAQFVGASGLGDADDSFDLEQAHITWRAPVGNGLDISFGKFVTMHGGEVIESWSHFNYSRGLLFTYAIPFTHTGIRTHYAFSPEFAAGLHLVNGWDNVDDNNKSKTVGTTAALTPFARTEGLLRSLSIGTNFMYGPEQDDENSHARTLLDLVVTWQPIDRLELLANYDYAEEEEVPVVVDLADGPGGPLDRSRDAQWYGFAFGGRYWICREKLALAARGEYFKDSQGVRTIGASEFDSSLGPSPSPPRGQVLRGVTITLDYRPWEFLILRPEFRIDWGSRKSFDGGREAHQTTVAFSAVFLLK